MARKKSSVLDDLVDIASQLPWKVGVGLAVIRRGKILPSHLPPCTVLIGYGEVLASCLVPSGGEASLAHVDEFTGDEDEQRVCGVKVPDQKQLAADVSKNWQAAYAKRLGVSAEDVLVEHRKLIEISRAEAGATA